MAAIRLAIIGEGPNDYGALNGQGEWEEGAAQQFVRAIAVDRDIQFEAIHRVELSKKSLQTPGRYRQGFKGLGGMLPPLFPKLKDRGLSGLVFFHDLDKTQGISASENECKRRFSDFMADLNAAIAWFEGKTGIKCIPMIPARMLECWLMADAQAYAQVFGQNPKAPALPNKPELVWGEKGNPKSDHPKHFLKRILQQFGLDSSTETMREIAQHSLPATLAQRCAISYPNFEEAMQVWMNTLKE